MLAASSKDVKDKNARIAALQAELAAARSKPTTRSLPSGASSGESPLSLLNQYSKKGAKLSLKGDGYTLNKMAKKQLIEGKSGNYYRLTLRQPNGKGFKFASGRYSRVVPEAPFKQALDNVISDIQSGLDGRRAYQLYARGNASAGRYTGKQEKGYEFDSLMVLKKNSATKKYAEPLEEYPVGKVIHNNDLPNLRGAYLQDLIGQNYSIDKPVLLNGKVSKSKNAAKQAVSLILFVED